MPRSEALATDANMGQPGAGGLARTPGCPGEFSPDELLLIPDFITLRPERFGLLLFQPYLGIEFQLDPVEAFTARLLTGRHSGEQIINALRMNYGFSKEQAWERVAALADRLEKAGALVRRKGAPEGRVRLPDQAIFPTDAPLLSAPKNVIWDVTYACNLRCPHCLTSSGSARAGELDTAAAKMLIDRLAEARVLYLSLSGGEPLRRADILELIEHTGTTGIRLDVATNGVGVPPAVFDRLSSLPVFQVQVSVDGLGEDHDRFRGMPGAFAEMCRTVQRFMEMGILVSASTTVTRENLGQLDAIIDWAVEMGLCGYKAIPFIPAGRGRINAGRLALDQAGQLQVARVLARRQEQLGDRLTISTETSFSFLLDESRASEGCQTCGMMGCAAGYDTLSVGADGTAYPCPFLHDFPLGSLLEQPLAALWRTSAVLKSLRGLDPSDLAEPCRSCPDAGGRCRGGCRASAYFASGSLLGADPGCYRALCKPGVPNQLI